MCLASSVLLQTDLVEVVRQQGTIPTPRYSNLDEYVAAEQLTAEDLEDTIESGHISVLMRYDVAQADHSGHLSSWSNRLCTC